MTVAWCLSVWSTYKARIWQSRAYHDYGIGSRADHGYEWKNRVRDKGWSQGLGLRLQIREEKQLPGAPPAGP